MGGPCIDIPPPQMRIPGYESNIDCPMAWAVALVAFQIHNDLNYIHHRVFNAIETSYMKVSMHLRKIKRHSNHHFSTLLLHLLLRMHFEILTAFCYNYHTVSR